MAKNVPATTQIASSTNTGGGTSSAVKAGVGKIWADIPSWARGIIIVLVIIIILLIVWKLYKKFFGQGASEQWSMEEDVRDSQRDLNDEIKKGNKPSYGQAQYSSWADSLNKAFSGCGTSFGAVKRIMEQMKNKSDVLALNATYGARKHDDCNWQFNFGDVEATLGGALSDELSNKEVEEINSMFKTKNISFRY